MNFFFLILLDLRGGEGVAGGGVISTSSNLGIPSLELAISHPAPTFRIFIGEILSATFLLLYRPVDMTGGSNDVTSASLT